MAAGDRCPAGRLQGAARPSRGLLALRVRPGLARSATTCTWPPRRTTCCCGARASSCCCPTAACSPSTARAGTATARTAAGDRLRIECLEPFRRWRGRYAAPVHRLAGDEIVAGPRPGSELVEAVIDLEVDSVAAPWNTEGDWGEQPPSLRYHQFYDARGTVTVGGTAYPFAGPGFRSHSRRRRDMPGFTGHAIINGRFPSGRGFGLLRYRATADRPERGRGFLYLDGVLHDADVVTWPHLDEAVAGGERLTIELHAGRHKAVITAETIASAFVTPAPEGRTYGAHVGDEPGTVISPAFARYEWDGEIGYGGLERSALRAAPSPSPPPAVAEDERNS